MVWLRLRLTGLDDEEPFLTGALLGDKGLPSYTQESPTSLSNGDATLPGRMQGPVGMGAIVSPVYSH